MSRRRLFGKSPFHPVKRFEQFLYPSRLWCAGMDAGILHHNMSIFIASSGNSVLYKNFPFFAGGEFLEKAISDLIMDERG